MKSKKNIKSIIVLAAVGIISLFFINISLNMSLAANTGKISVETANLRETADANSKILEQLSINEEVEIIEKQGDWYKVKAQGITGYLRQDLLQVANEQQNTNQTNTTNNAENEQNVANNQETTQTNVTDTKEEIKLGKYKIAEDTKLKIVPVINATDIIEVKKDEEVEVTEIINDWLCVETKTTKGWIRKEKIQTAEQQTQTVEAATTQTVIKIMYTNSETVNVRKEANTTSEIVIRLSLNTSVEIFTQENGWSKVRVSGKEGYISTSLLSDKKEETSRGTTTSRKEQTTQTTTQANKNTSSQAKTSTDTAKEQTKTTTTASVPTSKNGASIVSIAKQYIGCKYVYGGTTPNGFDCSGFTSYIYRKFGVNLNRTAAGQYSNGTAVSRSQLQPGDLVMFGKSGINHVGIYIGGGSIVHAANRSRGVTIDSINSGYYNRNYVGARRIL